MAMITGAAVKSAALGHAARQLAHAGISAPGEATFKGQTAYAAWTENLAGKTISWIINYPELPDNARLSRAEADLIAGYTLHEISHVLYTKSGVTKGCSGLIHALWNGIEDARIEHAQIVSRGARNASVTLRRLMASFTVDMERKGFNPCSLNWAPVALALVCRAAYGEGPAFARKLLDRIPEPKRSIYAEVAAAMPGLPLDRSGSLEVLNLAEYFLSRWKLLEPDATTKVEPVDPSGSPRGNPGGEQEGEPEDKSDGNTDEDGDFVDRPQAPISENKPDDDRLGVSDDSEESGSGSSSKSDDADDESDESDGSGESNDSDDESDDDGHWTGSDGDDDWDDEDDLFGGKESAEERAEREANEAAEDAMQSELDKNAEQAESSLFEETAGTGADADLDLDSLDASMFEDVESEGEVHSPEPSVDEVFKAAADRVKSPINLKPPGPASESYMGRWNMEAIKNMDESTGKRWTKAFDKTTAPAVSAQLYRILKAPELRGWDHGARSGRFDPRRMTRAASGAESVFKSRWEAEGIDTAVSILIDLSGSMKGHRVKDAVNAAWTLARACEKAGADVEVCGFNDVYQKWVVAGRTLDNVMVEPSPENSSDNPRIVVMKRWNDALRSVVAHFQATKWLASGGTPDYSAARHQAAKLANMPHARKLLIIVTDGVGDEDAMLEFTKVSHELLGVDVIGFGVGHCQYQLPRAYAIGVPVGGDMQMDTMKAVADQLKARDLRRKL